MLRKIGTAMALVAMLLPWRTTGGMIVNYEFNLLQLIQFLFQNENLLRVAILLLFPIGILLSVKYPMAALIGVPSIVYSLHEAISGAMMFRDSPFSFIGYGLILAAASVISIIIGYIMETKSVITVIKRR